MRQVFWYIAGRFHRARALRAARRFRVLRQRAEAFFARLGPNSGWPDFDPTGEGPQHGPGGPGPLRIFLWMVVLSVGAVTVPAVVVGVW